MKSQNEFSDISGQLDALVFPQEVRGEVIINRFRIALSFVFLGFLLFVVSSNDFRISTGNIIVFTCLAFGLVYSLVISFFLRPGRYHGSIKFISPLFEAIVITAVVFSGSEDLFASPASVFIVNGYAAYFVFTGLSALRLSYRACLFSGFLNALGYGTVIAWSLSQNGFDVFHASETGYQVRFSIDNEIIKVIFIVIAGFVAAYSTRRNKSLVLDTLEKQQAIDELNRNLEEKVQDRTRLLKEKQAQLDSELNTAREIQTRLLPRSLPELARLDVAFTFIPVSKVGGDFYDLVKLDQNRIGIFICDVSGHGVPAAFIATMVKVMLRQLSHQETHTHELMKRLNDELMAYMGKDFLTACYGILDLRDMSLEYCNAGHVAPILVKDGGIFRLDTRGICLGAFSDAEFGSEKIQLNAFDRLLFFTDGLTEARSEMGDFYGDNKLAQLLKTSPAEQTSNETLNRIVTDVSAFKGHSEFEDDVTALLLKVI